MYARAGYAQAPYSGTVLPAPTVGWLPPPIPGDPANFRYAASLGAYPWAYASWAGGYPPPTYPGGGVLLHADAAAGVMRVSLWWPDAPLLRLVRIDMDGTRTPVRTAYPLTVVGATRRNFVTNPSVEAGLNGFVPDAGSPTLSQLAMVGAPAGNYVLRATKAGAGSNGVTVPTAVTGTPAGRQVTVGFSLRASALPTSVTITVAWTDAGGGALTANTATLSADQCSAAVGQFARSVVTVTPPAGAVTPTLKIVAAGMPAGGTIDLDALTFEYGTTDGSFFDGRTVGATWLGSADLSASVLAPVQTIVDGEAPTDILVSYELSYPGITGGRVVSSSDTLLSNGATWLTHPLTPGSPIAVNLTEVPDQQYEVDQGIFLPIGAARPIVVSSAKRQASTGVLSLVALSFAERDTMVGLLATPSPMLLRPPGVFGYTPLWLAFGTVTQKRPNRKAWHDTVFLDCQFTEVDAPSVL